MHDTVDWVWNLLTTEMNSATDNPMIFAEVRSASSQPAYACAGVSVPVLVPVWRLMGVYLWMYFLHVQTGKVISAGNFHGEYPAKAADYLAIGVTELANVSGTFRLHETSPSPLRPHWG